MAVQLKNGEYLVARIKRHWFYLVLYVFGTILLGAIFPLAFFLPFYALARYFVDEITLTNQKLYVRLGLFDKEVNEIPLNQVTDVNCEQNIFGRTFNYGTIYVQTVVAIGGIDYSYIANPEMAKTMIAQAATAVKEEQQQK